ncbi:Golgi transport complex subunit 7 [Castilleja foliolosa]|uniref:Golgi transport complex subunit 7 n=1 Tax=Castilleja foliolosa TaxID=1961234 RepID=A0ABD3CC91_9LAMI
MFMCYHPYGVFKQRYGQMECGVLFGGVAGFDLRGVSTRIIGVQGVELSGLVRRMEETIPQVILLLEAASERCMSFSCGSEVDELILALDDATIHYISTLQGNLKSLSAVCVVDVTVDTVGAKKDTGSDRKETASHARKVGFTSTEEEWSFVQGALQILTVSDCLTSRISVFEASLSYFYMKTGICKFGITCKFNHPIDRSKPQAPGTDSQQDNVKLTLAGLPRREGAVHCPYYMKTGTCKFGATCKFDHPPPGEVMAAATTQQTSSPAAGEEEKEGKEDGDD